MLSSYNLSLTLSLTRTPPHTLPAFLLAGTDMGAAGATVMVEELLTFDSSISPISWNGETVIILFFFLFFCSTPSISTRRVHRACNSVGPIMGVGEVVPGIPVVARDDAHIDIVAAGQLHLRQLTGRRQGICAAEGRRHDRWNSALQLGRSFVEGECATHLQLNDPATG